MNLLMIVTDLGRMKAYRITRDEDDPTTSPAFEDLVDDDLKNLHSRKSERVTDQAGRFPSGRTGLAAGEKHNEEKEALQSQLDSIVERINDVAKREPGKICLAAPQPMHRKLLDALRPEVRERVFRDLALGLVKAPKLELLQRFQLT